MNACYLIALLLHISMLPSLTALCCSSSCPRPYLIHKHARETCHTHTGTGRSRGRISLGRRPRRRRLRLAHNCVAEAVELGHLLVHLCLRHLSRQASMSCAPKHVMSAHHERPSPCRASLLFFLVSAALSTCLQTRTHGQKEERARSKTGGIAILEADARAFLCSSSHSPARAHSAATPARS
jgi:hypothetical protein